MLHVDGETEAQRGRLTQKRVPGLELGTSTSRWGPQGLCLQPNICLIAFPTASAPRWVPCSAGRCAGSLHWPGPWDSAGSGAASQRGQDFGRAPDTLLRPVPRSRHLSLLPTHVRGVTSPGCHRCASSRPEQRAAGTQPLCLQGSCRVHGTGGHGEGHNRSRGTALSRCGSSWGR